MAVSDKELNAVVGFYMGLRKVVFMAGIVVLVAAAVGIVGAAFILGRENAAPVVRTSGTVDRQPQEKAHAVKRATPRRPRSDVEAPPEPVIEETEAEPEPENEAALTEMPAPAPLAASPVVVLVPEPVPDFSVTVKPKRHRWPRRFFGAIGRGLGKVIGVR